MKRSIYVAAAIAAFLVPFHGIGTAQSDNRDNPTPLASAVLNANIEDNKEERFYSFTAGPGQLTVQADIQPSRGSSTTNIAFELLAKNASAALLCCEGVQGDFGASGRETATVKLTRRQTVILHITNNGGHGTYEFRFSGAAFAAGSGSAGAGAGTGNERDTLNERDNGGGGHSRGGDVGVPATGTLRVRMKDGTFKDFDLRRVRDVSVVQQ